MSHLFLQGNALRIPLADQSVDLVFGSPPYMEARLYLEDGKDIGIARNVGDWVDWMLGVTEEALRVSRGAVVWVAAGVTRDRNYQPACEGLMWEWHKRGGHAYRPCYWHRVGIPGSGGNQWFRADVEYVMCFKRPGKLPWTDNTAMGQPPRWGAGGEMSHRVKDGDRRNQWGKHENSRNHYRRADGEVVPFAVRPSHRFHTKRLANGGMEEQFYVPPCLVNPGNLIKTNAGGHHLGSPLAHENEAPFAEDLAKFFVRSLCPPGGLVLDPFSGSGTTVAVAEKHERHGLGLDLRRSQCLLGERRVKAGMRPVSKLDGEKALVPLPGQLTMFGGENA